MQFKPEADGYRSLLNWFAWTPRCSVTWVRLVLQTSHINTWRINLFLPHPSHLLYLATLVLDQNSTTCFFPVLLALFINEIPCLFSKSSLSGNQLCPCSQKCKSKHSPCTRHLKPGKHIVYICKMQTYCKCIKLKYILSSVSWNIR